MCAVTNNIDATFLAIVPCSLHCPAFAQRLGTREMPSCLCSISDDYSNALYDGRPYPAAAELYQDLHELLCGNFVPNFI